MGILDRFKNMIRFDKATVETETTTTTSTDLTTLKVTELKALAKERGLKGYSTLKKTDLISLLSE